MSDAQTGYAGHADTTAWMNDYNALIFTIQQMIAEGAYAGPALVKACTNSGTNIAPGTVDVQPMVSQIDGQGNGTPHGVVLGLPYFRLQGGGSGMICDPVAGDIGLAVFCDRDISSVKANKAPSLPGSRRINDWADGIYIGGILGAAILTQFLMFNSAGASLVSPIAITLTSPTVTTSAVLVAGNGATGSFTSADGKTVTVSHGIVTSIV